MENWGIEEAMLIGFVITCLMFAAGGRSHL